MLHDLVAVDTTDSPADLLQQYESEIADIVRHHGIDTLQESTDLDRGILGQLAQGNAGPVDLTDIAIVIAFHTESSSPETVLAELRNHLLLQMSTAITNVDILAQEIQLDLDPNELQGKIEGRLPITLSEFAVLHYHLVRGAAT